MAPRYAAFLEVLDNQLRDNDPPETRATVERLSGLGIEPEEVRRLVACVIAAEIYAVVRTRQGFDRERFVSRLKMLPDMRWMDDEDEHGIPVDEEEQGDDH